MSSNINTVLVTGASGFLGAHVTYQLLLASKYQVKGAARSSKLSLLQERYARFGDKFEAVGIDDLVSGDFSAALKGVDAVVHLAAPLVGKEATPEKAIEVAVEGSLNILRQAEAVGVKSFVFMSSILAVADLNTRIPQGIKLSDDEWLPLTKEDALRPGVHPFVIYAAEKALSERAVWGFAEKHPHLEVAAFNPPFFFGPFAPGYTIDDGSLSAFSTNSMIYDLLRPNGPLPLGAAWIDVRDVATAAIAALHAPPTSKVGRKRYIIGGEYWFSPQEAANYISELRPDLKGRLSEAWKSSAQVPKSIVDSGKAKKGLGIEFTPWKTTILNAVDSIIEIENGWREKGVVPH